jgi:hypothetical protein
MAFQKYSEEKRNEILDSQQEKNARGKISLLLNLGFPKDWIEKMLPYINEDTTSWQLRMISLRSRSGRSRSHVGRFRKKFFCRNFSVYSEEILY